MLPRLDAEEALSAINNIALGTGSVKSEDAKRAMRDLEKRAGGGARHVRRAGPADLAAMGIGVRRV